MVSLIYKSFGFGNAKAVPNTGGTAPSQRHHTGPPCQGVSESRGLSQKSFLFLFDNVYALIACVFLIVCFLLWVLIVN